MAEQKDPPRPHGDPLGGTVADSNPEDNRAQRQSDAAPDAMGAGRDGRSGEESDREGGRGSDANGVTASDEADGQRRKRQYENGAEIVSRID